MNSEDHIPQSDRIAVRNTKSNPFVPSGTTNELNLELRVKNLLRQLEDQKDRMAQEREEHRLSLERRDLEIQRHRRNSAAFDIQRTALDADLKTLLSEKDRLARKLVYRDNEIQRLQQNLEQKTHYAQTRQNALESINARIDSLHASIEEKEHIIDFQKRELGRLGKT